jgi:hypothetical protein
LLCAFCIVHLSRSLLSPLHANGRLATSGTGRGPTPSSPSGPGTRRDSLGAFLVAGATWVAEAPKTSQRLLKRALSHFAYDESPAPRTRICCVAAAAQRAGIDCARAIDANAYRGRKPSYTREQLDLTPCCRCSRLIAPLQPSPVRQG